jgi:hypothetical protein
MVGGALLGVRYGLSIAIGCTALVALLAGMGADRALIDEFGLTVVQMGAWYFLVGLVGGAAIGCMVPLIRSEIAAMVLGFFASCAVLASAEVAVVPRGLWFPEGLVVVLGVSAYLGPWAGRFYWEHRLED